MQRKVNRSDSDYHYDEEKIQVECSDNDEKM